MDIKALIKESLLWLVLLCGPPFMRKVFHMQHHHLLLHHPSQKIRMPEEIKKTRFATCLDSALLFASCLEAAGLNPVLVLMKEHAFVGYWLIDKTFQYVTCNDATDIRNSIALDDLKLFETTFVTSGGNIQFNQAIEDATRKLAEHNEADFVYAIDLRQARDRSIRPIQMEQLSQTPDSDPTKRESIPLPLLQFLMM